MFAKFQMLKCSLFELNPFSLYIGSDADQLSKERTSKRVHSQIDDERDTIADVATTSSIVPESIRKRKRNRTQFQGSGKLFSNSISFDANII